MTAIDAVSVFLPSHRVPIETLAAPLRLTEMQIRLFRRFHGLTEVRRDPARSLPDLLLRAADGLTALRGAEHRVRFVLYGRAFPVVAPYPANPLHDVCRALGLGHALAFTLTQQSCASALTAIEVAGRLLAAEPHQPGEEPLALVLTGEKAFTRDAQFIPETSVFSEGASACLVSAHGDRDRLLAYACAQRGEFDVAGGESPARFQRAYRPALADVIGRALADAGVGLADLRLVLPHNVNLMTWKRLCKLIGLPLDKVLLDNITGAGHVYCADAFVNYRTARERDLLRPGDRYLVAAVGAGDGATFAAMVFEH
ncbi:3-oxoacyl-[acyl-carrier-protein] synthase III C-terminal domain-containing protein [Micromonospora sp. WMMD975]|uniref:3-oxoacyl-[acyl-carrier-protein] synthase III C-terminal domain-containing protein n=1 Tax=Micromonospora sp. WMMD975 TaxID=3016087 RepID=UPI002499CA04|nr:3-oxoacyl-[acyl-carrier-protein] synthase III C-terminal domain-containing protein [Micromonospora sp. WMMD975]WFE36206.1 3-oxoacyl-[acyl-carrier-protein] synthase III C-terminal domain-containing protein [Micromonospora sp. WMMD975]